MTSLASDLLEAQPIELDTLDDIALLRLSQTGDMLAFAELQARLEAPIRRYTWRLIGTHGETDDIVQDALIAFYLSLDRIQPPENLRPYLFRIVRNRCYDILRQQRRYEQLSLDEEPVESWVSLHSATAQDEPDQAVQWLLMHMEVQAAMQKLPEHQRQALLLYAEENLSYQEIATATNASIGTVKSRLFHAKRALRGLISAATLELLTQELGIGEE